MTETEIHPYFVAKARQAFARHGGNPDLSGPLAEWAQTARPSDDTRRGVIVGEDGTILAETLYSIGGHATYVTDEDSTRWGLLATEVGMARGQIQQRSCQRNAHITFSEVCLGAGHA